MFFRFFLILMLSFGLGFSADMPSGAAQVTKSKKADRINPPEGARCPICGMKISKNPQWVAMIQAQKEDLYFDGVKDMMKYFFEKGRKFDQIYVSDYYKLHKIDAKSAFFVIGSNVLGPMGNELIPFENEEDALTFAKDHFGKKIVKFDEITPLLVDKLL